MENSKIVLKEVTGDHGLLSCSWESSYSKLKRMLHRLMKMQGINWVEKWGEVPPYVIKKSIEEMGLGRTQAYNG
ncbi:betaine-aldehyde dehydrogenase [Sesbania bispinosa]|nr:betaine-aldehyde dehydrogenase [Sesbania bispinosa]